MHRHLGACYLQGNVSLQNDDKGMHIIVLNIADGKHSIFYRILHST